MSKSYIGVAPFTMARTTTGSYTNIYAGQPVPEDVDPDDLKRLVDEKFLGEVAASNDGDSKSDTIKAILAEVGDDKDKAAAALDQEKAKGDDARPTLVEKLEAIANPQS